MYCEVPVQGTVQATVSQRPLVVLDFVTPRSCWLLGARVVLVESSPDWTLFQTLPNSVEDVLVLEDVIGLLPTANFRQWS
jgi:hypothetical protein